MKKENEKKRVMPKGKMITLMLDKKGIMIGFLEKDIKKENWIEVGKIEECEKGYVFHKKLVCGKLELPFKEDLEMKEMLSLVNPESIVWIANFENDHPTNVLNLPEERSKIIQKDKIIFTFGREEDLRNLDLEGKNAKFINMDEEEKEEATDQK